MLTKLLAMKNSYVKSEDGATAIEYALLAAGVSLAIIAIVYVLGDKVLAIFTNLSDQL